MKVWRAVQGMFAPASKNLTQTPGTSLFDRCGNPDCNRARGLHSLNFRMHPGLHLGGHAGGHSPSHSGSQWYCGVDCIEQASTHLFSLLSDAATRRTVAQHRMPLGLLLLARGDITAEQLTQALTLQRSQSSGRIGEWLQHIGAVQEAGITAALSQQWACPVMSLRPGRDLAAATRLPLALMEGCRMLPVHWNPATHILHVAFVHSIDYPALMAIQYQLPCTTEAGVVGASDFERQLDRERQISRPREVGIRTPLDAAEMARVLRNYSQRLDPQSIRACRCQHMIWVRLFTRTQPFDLVFTTLAEPAEELAQLPLTQAR